MVKLNNSKVNSYVIVFSITLIMIVTSVVLLNTKHYGIMEYVALLSYIIPTLYWSLNLMKGTLTYSTEWLLFLGIWTYNVLSQTNIWMIIIASIMWVAIFVLWWLYLNIEQDKVIQTTLIDIGVDR